MLNNEFELIRLLTAGKQSAAFQQACGVVTGIGDDAAVVDAVPGSQLVMSCDAMVEDIHFKTVTMRDRDVGYKAMASAISDIAAMGALPKFAMVSVSLPKTTSKSRIRDIYEGLYECANRWSVVIVGGDTTGSMSGISIHVSVIGEVEAGKALLRSKAQVGDVVFVTGYPGQSAAGLELLLERNVEATAWPAPTELTAPLIEAHCRPEPQVHAGRLLQRIGACHALNDVSDGVASEAWEIAEASGVGIDLIEERIPVSDELFAYAAGRRTDPLSYVFFGGEDYQLIGTLPAEHALSVQLMAKDAGLLLHMIGYVNGEHNGVCLVRHSGEIVALEKKGYNHFREG